MAIIREGGLENLSADELQRSCFMRGLNAADLSYEEQIKFMDQWLHISEHINTNNFSLFLHLPILITYNHPNNWKLIYPDRK